MRFVTKTAVVFLILAAFAPLAVSQSSLDEGPIVRRQLLYRSDRFEVNPAIGHTLNDTYRRALFLDVGANYHLTNTFSLGVNVGWGALQYNSGLLSDIETTNPSAARALNFAETTLLSDFHLGYVPYYGKFNFLEATTVNFDLHLVAGLAAALLSSDSPDLEGFKFGPSIGAGLRFFLDGDKALTIDIVDHMYSTATVQRGDARVEESFSHNVMVRIGMSFFVTGELRVSR